MDALTHRVAARWTVAKAVSLLPGFQVALHEYQKKDVKPMLAFLQQVLDVVFPNHDGHPPPWFNALSTVKQNSINSLQKEAHVFLMELPSLAQVAPDSMLWDSFAHRLAAWAKRLRGLEIASQASDEEREIKHGPFIIVPMPGLPRKEAEAALEALDAAVEKIRPKFPEVLYGHVYFSTTLGAKNSATYVYGNDTIQLSTRARKRFSDMQTLIHEFGHRYDHKFFKNAELRKEFWGLSTRKEFETINFDAKLRHEVAEGCLSMAKARKDGTPMPILPETAMLWITTQYTPGADIKKVNGEYLAGKLSDHEYIARIMGHEDFKISTGTILHGPLHVTPYGGTKPTENFAEAFAFYVLGLSMPAELAAIMAKLH